MRKNSFQLNVKLPTILLVWLCAAGGAVALGQQAPQEEPLDVAPPPVVALSSGERTQLASETDLKRRVQLCLQLADARLQRAEQSTTNEDHQAALLELGGYRAVIQNGLNYLRQINNDSRRVRDNFRRMEMALRTHTPRLETIRRSTPYEYAFHLKTIMLFARDARTTALNSFFSDSVLPGTGATAAEASDSETEPKSGATAGGAAANAAFPIEKKP